MLFVIPALAYGGLRLGLLALFGVGFWGMVDMWYEAMSTLSLMLVSVGFSAIIGILLGIFAASSDRFDAFLRPVSLNQSGSSPGASEYDRSGAELWVEFTANAVQGKTAAGKTLHHAGY